MANPNPFSPEVVAKAVHASLDEAFAAIPEGRNHAFLVDASTDAGVRAVYAQRAPGGWQVALEGQWHGRGHAAGKVSALKSW